MTKKHPDWGVVVTGAGASVRFQNGNKLLAELGGKPVFLHSLLNFLPYLDPGHLVLTVSERDRDRFAAELAAHNLSDVVVLTLGGASRTESVWRGLAALPATVRRVAIHDAARPLASGKLLVTLLSDLSADGIVSGRRVVDSLKKLDETGFITDAVDREQLFRAETPQVFDLDKYRMAGRICAGTDFTDDAEMMRQAGFKVKVHCDRNCNLKITTYDDLLLCRRLLGAPDKNDAAD